MNLWKSGITGVVVGDALGCPVQFESREAVARHPVTGMRGYGTFNLPPGSWTDDSSLTLALLESIRRTGGIDCTDIMDNFVKESTGTVLFDSSQVSQTEPSLLTLHASFARYAFSSPSSRRMTSGAPWSMTLSYPSMNDRASVL